MNRNNKNERMNGNKKYKANAYKMLYSVFSDMIFTQSLEHLLLHFSEAKGN